MSELLSASPGPSRRARRALRACAVFLVCLAAPGRAQEPVVGYAILNGGSIPASLSGRKGNAVAGRTLYSDADRAGCSGCHGSPDGPGAPSPGAPPAPKLDRVATRLSEGEIRLWLVAPEVLSPGTAMPAYYAVGQRDDPSDPRFGEPRLTASEIEDLVAYLLKAGR